MPSDGRSIRTWVRSCGLTARSLRSRPNVALPGTRAGSHAWGAHATARPASVGIAPTPAKRWSTAENAGWCCRFHPVRTRAPAQCHGTDGPRNRRLPRTYPALLRAGGIPRRLVTRTLRTAVCSICAGGSPSIGALAYAWPEPSASQDGDRRDAEELTPTFPDGAETHAAFLGMSLIRRPSRCHRWRWYAA